MKTWYIYENKLNPEHKLISDKQEDINISIISNEYKVVDAGWVADGVDIIQNLGEQLKPAIKDPYLSDVLQDIIDQANLIKKIAR